jgi:hypothetical protein
MLSLQSFEINTTSPKMQEGTSFNELFLIPQLQTCEDKERINLIA